MNETYTSYEHPKFACRRFARQIWQENPKLTAKEMMERYEIKYEACKGYEYKEAELRAWILPDQIARAELNRYRELSPWKIEEAMTLWLNLNPFILHLSFHSGDNASFWRDAYHPSSREMLYRLQEKTERAAFSGQLPTTKSDDGKYWVIPRDYYNWAIKYSGQHPEPDGEKFFEELKLEWEKLDELKKENKVDLKINEIRRIVNCIEAIDPDFNPSSMPGRKQDFHKLCQQLNKPMFSVALSTFSDYLISVCSFNAGARETDYYAKLASKLG